MADEDQSQKTEDPTARKLAKAKQKGQVGTSQEVKNWVIILGGTMAIAMLAPWMMKRIAVYSFRFIAQPDIIPVDLEHLRLAMSEALIEMGVVLAPIMAMLILLAMLSSVAQSGLIWSPDRIKPKWNKLSLLGGLKRMFATRAVVEFLKGLAKLGIVTFVAVSMALPWVDDIALMPDFDLFGMLDRLHLVVIALASGTLMVMTVIATLDFVYQKWEHTKTMRMSRQEVKDEHKETEGDPQIKARIRKIRMERAQQRMMANVPDADVVVTNPTHYAIALSYKMDDMQAPVMVAKGVDHLAFRIREVAEEHDIPIVENPPLARALYSAVEIDEEIPVEHYKAVAEVIGYVMRLKGDRPGGQQD